VRIPSLLPGGGVLKATITGSRGEIKKRESRGSSKKGCVEEETVPPRFRRK